MVKAKILLENNYYVSQINTVIAVFFSFICEILSISNQE